MGRFYSHIICRSFSSIWYLHRSIIKLFAFSGSEGSIGENKRRQMKEKQDELEIEKAKEALLKKQRPLEVSIFNILADSFPPWCFVNNCCRVVELNNI